MRHGKHKTPESALDPHAHLAARERQLNVYNTYYVIVSVILFGIELPGRNATCDGTMIETTYSTYKSSQEVSSHSHKTK